jgi:nitroreductase
MKRIENQILLNQLKWRYATKKFDATRKIPSEDWNTLEQALILSASSYGLQPWHFVVVTSQAMKDKLMPAAYGQEQVSHASHVVVFAMKKSVDEVWVDKYVRRISQVRGAPVEKLGGFKGMMTGTLAQLGAVGVEAWTSKQVYIALGNLLTCAALLGIDACPMEGINPSQFDQILGLDKTGYGSLAIVTLGYRAADDTAAKSPKVRFEASDVVTHID